MNNKMRFIEIIVAVAMVLCMVSGLEAIILIPGGSSERWTTDWYPEEHVRMWKYSQPDGTEIEFEEYMGGVNNPWIKSLFRINDFTVIGDLETEFICWARQGADGRLESTGYPVHLYDPVELGLEKDIRMSRERAEMERTRDRRYFDPSYTPRIQPEQDSRSTSEPATCPTEASAGGEGG